MGKYIINVDDKYVSPDNELIVSHKNLFDGCSYHIQIAKLTPYTEPDMEQVRKEGYQQGYEQGYKDGYNEPGKGKIQVGDEVISPDGKGVVTEISDRIVRIMYPSGSGYIIKPEELIKTGRHFPEIAEVLAKMKETDNG